MFTCFSGEGHFFVTQEPCVAEVRYSNVQGVIKKNVAGLQVAVNEFGLLLVQVLHSLGYFQGPAHSLLQGWKWHHPLPAPVPRPMEPLLQRGAEVLGDHPRVLWRLDARAHELKHEPVALARQRFEFLGEVNDAVFICTEKFLRYALHSDLKSTPCSPVNLCGASFPNFFFQFNLCITKFTYNDNYYLDLRNNA